jgi:hypothetical protein
MRLLRRIAPFVVPLVLWVPSAGAWTWPVGGAVLQGFTFDHAHPYAAGQHRGIDVGAAPGESVLAPASGVVSFAGSVPTSGRSVTIETPGGLSVTLTHLGSVAVARNDAVAEGAVVGTVGPSGTPEVDGPYVHLGVRAAADDQGYLDPLGLLPVLAPPVPALAPAVPPASVVAPAPVASPAPPVSSAPPAASLPPAAPAEPAVASAPPADASRASAPEPVASAPTAVASRSVHDAPPVTAEPPVPAAPVAAPPLEQVAVPAVAPVPEAVAPAAAPEAAAPATRAWTALVPDRETAATAEPKPARSLEPLAFLGGTLQRLTASVAQAASQGAPTESVREVRGRSLRAFVPASRAAAPAAPAADVEPGTHGPAAVPAVLQRAHSLAWLVLVVLALGGFVAGGLAAARIIRSPSPTSEGARPVSASEEDPRRARVAVRQWAAPHRSRGRVRRAGGRFRAVSPTEGQRRSDGQRDGRARNAGDGVRRPERRIAA